MFALSHQKRKFREIAVKTIYICQIKAACISVPSCLNVTSLKLRQEGIYGMDNLSRSTQVKQTVEKLYFQHVKSQRRSRFFHIIDRTSTIKCSLSSFWDTDHSLLKKPWDLKSVFKICFSCHSLANLLKLNFGIQSFKRKHSEYSFCNLGLTENIWSHGDSEQCDEQL